MWRVMMGSVLSIKTIDRLYSLRRNFFAIFHVDNIRASPALFLLVALYWAIPLAVVFPSGALTVEGRLHQLTGTSRGLPSFNPAFTGNGTLDDALQYSLAPDPFLFENAILEGLVYVYDAEAAYVKEGLTRTLDRERTCFPHLRRSVSFPNELIPSHRRADQTAPTTSNSTAPF